MVNRHEMPRSLQEMQADLAQIAECLQGGRQDCPSDLSLALAALTTNLSNLQQHLPPKGEPPATGAPISPAQALPAAIPDLIYRIGKDGVYRECLTPQHPQSLLDAKDCIGCDMRDVLPKDVADRHIYHLHMALMTGELQLYEQVVSTPAGLQYEEVRVIPNGPEEVLLIVRDISDRKQHEQSRAMALAQLQRLNSELEDRIQQRTAELQHQKMQLQDFFDHAHDLLQSVDLTTGGFEYVNRAWLETLGYTEADVSSLTIFDILHPDCHAHCQEVIQTFLSGQIDQLAVLEMTFVTREGRRVPLEGSVTCHQADDGRILTRGIFRDVSDRKQTEWVLQQQIQRERLLREISQRIRESLDLQTIFETACDEIRQMLRVDRVAIFRFYPDSHYDDGEFVAESGGDDIPSVRAVKVHDHCFGDNYAKLYAQGRYYVVDDIYSHNLSPCHSQILAQFQVRANLVMPLLCGETLWGLLCIHQCHGPYQWPPSVVDLAHQTSNQLAIAIQQASLYQQVQTELTVRQQAEARIAQQLHQQESLGRIIQQVRESLDLDDILRTVADRVQSVFGADRVIVFRLFADGRSCILEEAVTEDLPRLRDRAWDDEVWSQDILDLYWQGQPRIVPDVMADRWTDCLVDYSREGKIRSKMVAPILQELCQGETHRWVAPTENNKLWGVLVVHACHTQRVWQPEEAQLLQQIANQLAIAIQQSGLFAQLQQELQERQRTQTLLTERNAQLCQSNQELAEATRMKDEFLANMSHELRTPLNAILGMTEALQDEVFGSINHQQRRSLETVERSSTHLLALINDILDVAKIESGKITLEQSVVSVRNLCQSSLAFVNQQALKKQLHLTTQLPPHIPDLYVDERRIRQVLINLLSNAVKFTPTGGEITLAVRPAPNPIGDRAALCLEVIDTGIGISPDDQAKLFQPFVQVDGALNRKYEGTGLGLVLVKRTVELHGGQVSLTSAEGQGSRFAITLPLADQPPAPQSPLPSIASPRQTPSAPTQAAPLVLLAEDNAATIDTITAYLEIKGYRLLLARTGQEAIALAEAQQPDVILMDIQMPEMDGLAAIRQLRQTAPLQNTPILALTALAMTGDRDRCLAAGANEYLSKPIKLKHLQERIQAWLRESTED